MPTCEKPAPRHRPRLSELPSLFQRHGGNLQALGRELGYSAKQIGRWIKDAGDQRELLEWHLNWSRQESERTKGLRPSVPAVILPGELKQLVRTYYTTPWAELLKLEKDDLESQSLRAEMAPNDEGNDVLWTWINQRSTSVRTKPNPTTGETLHHQLSWADVRDLLDGLDERADHVARAWSGCPQESPLRLRLLAEDPPQAPSRVRDDEREALVRGLISAVAQKLIKRAERLLTSWEGIAPHRQPSQAMPEDCEAAQSGFMWWLEPDFSRREI